MSALLDVQNLAVAFDTVDGVVHAVNGISYTLDAGETLGIVGESGCGKSVGVLSLLGLIPRPPGRIAGGAALYQDQDLLQLNDQALRHIRGREISMVFQDPMTSFNPVLSIGRQLTEAQVFHLNKSWDEASGRAVELLDLVGIPQARDRLSSFPHEFSGGMRQRAMIAMALACKPNILIADEPTTALDVTIQAQIVDLVKGLRDQLGMAIIWITHDLGVIAGIAERVIVMYAGYIVEKGSVDNIYGDPRHPYTIALLNALPRVDRSRREKLTTLPGLPPDLLNLPDRCPFAPRCTYRVRRCVEANPSLELVASGHEMACWVDVTTGRER